MGNMKWSSHRHYHAQILGISNTHFRAIITSRKILIECFPYAVSRGRRRGSMKEKPINAADCWGGIKLNNQWIQIKVENTSISAFFSTTPIKSLLLFWCVVYPSLWPIPLLVPHEVFIIFGQLFLFPLFLICTYLFIFFFFRWERKQPRVTRLPLYWVRSKLYALIAL